MSAGFVADALVAVSWSVASQSSAFTDRLLDDVTAGGTIAVPPLWPYEVANSLVFLLRRRRIQKDDYASARSLLSKVADLAMEHGLTLYDAAYLELAVRKQLPLASRDRGLNRAAVSDSAVR